MADREPNWGLMKVALGLMALAIPLNVIVAARNFGFMAALNVVGLFCLGFVAGAFVIQMRSRSGVPK